MALRFIFCMGIMIQIEDNDSPITVAQKIIHGTKLVDMTPVRTLGVLLATGKVPEDREQYETDMFDDSENTTKVSKAA